MKFLKPKFWNTKNSMFAIMLWPISNLFYFITILRKIYIRQNKFKIPVICIGNIYVGGTGKTPLSIEIAKELIVLNKRPAIIKKFYKNQKDEHAMIQDKTNCLILKNNRIQAIKKAERENFEVAILDDGFQDHSIQKKFNILCFNSKQLVGNGLMFPAGPLRESLNSLKKAQIVIINGKKNEEFENKIYNISKNTKIFYSEYIPENIEQFKNKNLYAFAGIGNPSNFFELLSEYNLNIKMKIAFPDHYKLSKNELANMIDESSKNNFEIITTEKDFYRHKDHGFNKLKYLKIKLKIYEKNKLIKEILKNL